MTAPARRSVRKQTAAAFRKPTTRSLAQPQNATVPNRDTEDEDEEEEDEEDEEEHGRDGGDEEDDEDDDDASSDGLSITRCLCGEQHNVGLMVQCDKCEVWQHCDCVGLTEQEMPELYYCDQCQPDNHILYKSHGRYKRGYNPNGHTDHKRMAPSSSTKTTDESAAAATAGRSSKRRKPNGRAANLPKSPMTTRNQRATRHRATDEDSTAEENHHHPILTDELASEADERSRSGETMSPLPEEVPASPASSRTNNKKSSSRSRKTVNTSPRKKTPHHSKGSPRPSTPQDDPLSPVAAPASYWDEDGLPTQDDTVPARIKYPNPKMSIADMNKRAKQIFEYITKLQEDLSIKGRPRSDSTCSSLSSASTLPLNEEDNTLASPVTPMPIKSSHEQESVLDIMERVTCDLIQFQRKFGMNSSK